MSTATASLELRVRSVTWEADGIRSYELRDPAGGALPPFSAGAHIDLALGNGLTRSYSLVNPQEERHRYVIAVQEDRASRGGSRWIHQHLQAGSLLRVGAPRNNFPLDEDAADSVLVAGGIGVTPMLAMIARLTRLKRRWHLHYCARTRAQAAFVETLAAIAEEAGTLGRVHLNFDHEPGGALLDLPALVAGAPAGAHLYCCGPAPMLGAFEAATATLPAQRVHVEYFSSDATPASAGGFTVVLARAGRTLEIAPGSTILDALLEAGVEVPYSCMEGVCGSCETAVLDGLPDHRDLVLNAAEKAANRSMMICCSGCKGASLTLDL